MRCIPLLKSARVLLLLLAVGVNTPVLFGQAATARLHGDIADPTGAVIPGASVQAKGPDGKAVTVKTNGSGNYEFKDLKPGEYTITVEAENFTIASKTVKVAAGEDLKLDVSLKVAAQKGEILVEGQKPGVDVNPENNSSAVVLRGSDLDALSDDPDELQAQLSALAGPAAGPNGGDIYVDGFSGGQLPSKTSIKEVRINSNPFSAQYERPGYGRIEIFTQPGGDKFHGDFIVNGGGSIFNSRDPFVSHKPDSHWWSGGIRVGGPLRKNATFFIDLKRDAIDYIALVNAILPSAAFPSGSPFTQSVMNPRHTASAAPRADFKINSNNTLTARYSFSYSDIRNDGVGDLILPSQGYRRRSNDSNLQLTDTQVLSTKILNETRFQFDHSFNKQNPVSLEPAISVPGFFLGGGGGTTFVDTSDHYELSDDLSLVQGNHTARFGGRLRANVESNISTQNFNGAFTYKDLAAYEAGTPEFFLIAAGQPSISQTLYDIGVYGQDDWRLRPNVTLSYGLRYETQGVIDDHSDFAPRLAIGWGIDGHKKKVPKTVLRAGIGIFYNRFSQGLILQSERLNGVTQQQFLVNNPLFSPTSIPPISTLSTLSVSSPSIFQLDPKLRAPYLIQSAVTVEREVAKGVNFSVTYANSRGLHQLLIRDINAPMPGAVPANFSNPAFRALGGIYGNQNVYQYESAGIFKQNQLISSVMIRGGAAFSVGGFYMLNSANSDTAGAGSYVSNDFNIKADYGRTAFDIRHRFAFWGSVALPFSVHANSWMSFNSGSPYNITSPIDVNGDGILNDRPAFVNSSSTQIIATPNFPLKSFDIAPAAGVPVIPPYYGTGPNNFAVNLQLSKAFAFGPRNSSARPKPPAPGTSTEKHEGTLAKLGDILNRWGKASDRKYSLTFSAYILNILNEQDLGVPISVVGPRLGVPYTIASQQFTSPWGNRRVHLQARFSF